MIFRPENKMYNPLWLILFLLLFSCTNEHQERYQNFHGHSWAYGGKVVFKNDSILSFKGFDPLQKKMTGDTCFKLEILDSSLVYKRIEEKSHYLDGRTYIITGDTLLCDTVPYDFRMINNQAHLVLYLPNYPVVFTNTDPAKIVRETFNVQPTKFIMAGFSIADNIDRSLIKTRGIYNYKDYTIEDCELLDNNDIEIKLIGYNTIYAIERHNIPDFKVQEVIQIVSAKLGIQPQYSPMKKWENNSDYEYEFYRWNKNYVRVMLQRSRFVGTTNYYKNLFDKDSWTLYYDDDIQKALLIQKYKTGKETSTIIE